MTWLLYCAGTATGQNTENYQPVSSVLLSVENFQNSSSSAAATAAVATVGCISMPGNQKPLTRPYLQYGSRYWTHLVSVEYRSQSFTSRTHSSVTQPDSPKTHQFIKLSGATLNYYLATVLIKTEDIDQLILEADGMTNFTEATWYLLISGNKTACTITPGVILRSIR